MQVEIILSVTIPFLIISVCFSLWVYIINKDLLLFLALVITPIFVVICMILYYSAKANSYFDMSQRCLHLLKLKVQDILSFSKVYLGEDRIISQNLITKICVDSIKEET